MVIRKLLISLVESGHAFNVTLIQRHGPLRAPAAFRFVGIETLSPFQHNATMK